jgi:hypothetical protein
MVIVHDDPIGCSTLQCVDSIGWEGHSLQEGRDTEWSLA